MDKVYVICSEDRSHNRFEWVPRHSNNDPCACVMGKSNDISDRSSGWIRETTNNLGRGLSGPAEPQECHDSKSSDETDKSEPEISNISRACKSVPIDGELREFIEEDAGFWTFKSKGLESYLDYMSLWNFMKKIQSKLFKNDFYRFKKLYVEQIQAIVSYDRTLCVLHLNRLHPKLDTNFLASYSVPELRYLVIKTYGYVGRFYFPQLLYFLLDDEEDHSNMITVKHAYVFLYNFAEWRIWVTKRRRVTKADIQSALKKMYRSCQKELVCESVVLPFNFDEIKGYDDFSNGIDKDYFELVKERVMKKL